MVYVINFIYLYYIVVIFNIGKYLGKFRKNYIFRVGDFNEVSWYLGFLCKRCVFFVFLSFLKKILNKFIKYDLYCI